MRILTPEARLLDIIKKAQGKLRFSKEIKFFTNINIILISLTILIAIVFLIDIFTFDNMPELTLCLPKVEDDIAPVVTNLEDDLKERFQTIERDKGSFLNEDLIKNLTVVGIVTGKNNEVIIEDKSLNKTFFLHKGDVFGELKIFGIEQDRVILEYKGEKIELKM